MTIKFFHLCVAAFFGAASVSAFAVDNECAAEVSPASGTPPTRASDGSWIVTFHVKAGNGPTHSSNGSYTYAFTYLDESNVPHPNTPRSGVGWAPADGAEFDVTDTITFGGIAAISEVKVIKTLSGGCV